MRSTRSLSPNRSRNRPLTATTKSKQAAPPTNPVRPGRGATVTVSNVIDGDTIEVSPAVNGLKDVRLIGVDTPETVDPAEGVEPYGPQASAFSTRELSLAGSGSSSTRRGWTSTAGSWPTSTSGARCSTRSSWEKGYAQAYPYPPEHKAGPCGDLCCGAARGQGRGARDLGAHHAAAEVRAGGPG